MDFEIVEEHAYECGACRQRSLREETMHAHILAGECPRNGTWYRTVGAYTERAA